MGSRYLLRSAALRLEGLDRLTPHTHFAVGTEKVSRSNAKNIFAQPFDFQLAENCFPSLRWNKAMGAETRGLVVCLETRTLRYCRPADLQLPSGRLKLPVCHSADTRSSGDSRTTNDARERIERREGCARVRHNFQAVSNSHLAGAGFKSSLALTDFVTLRGSAPRTPKSKAAATCRCAKSTASAKLAAIFARHTRARSSCSTTDCQRNDLATGAKLTRAYDSLLKRFNCPGYPVEIILSHYGTVQRKPFKTEQLTVCRFRR